MLTLTSHSLPKELKRIGGVPDRLYVEGDLSPLMDRPRLAVIGSRKPTAYGRAVTIKLVQELVREGVVIISGLALGIDSIAHRACLDAGGQTIAVLPAGLDKIYPSSHANLASDIVRHGGALVTEYPANTTPYAVNFLARNRLISGLAEGVLVTEAAQRSGSLNTVNHALEQNRVVLTVPGNITSLNSTGCNNLLRMGAVPVTRTDDIFDGLGWTREGGQEQIVKAANPEEFAILSLIQKGISDGGELLEDSQLKAAVFSQTLTMLEITGRIKPLGGNQWAIA